MLSPRDNWLQIDQLIHTNNSQLHSIQEAMDAMQADNLFSEAEQAKTAALLLKSSQQQLNPASNNHNNSNKLTNFNGSNTVSYFSLSSSSQNTPVSSQNSTPSPNLASHHHHGNTYLILPQQFFNNRVLPTSLMLMDKLHYPSNQLASSSYNKLGPSSSNYSAAIPVSFHNNNNKTNNNLKSKSYLGI
jgi:hypothetical protein